MLLDVSPKNYINETNGCKLKIIFTQTLDRLQLDRLQLHHTTLQLMRSLNGRVYTNVMMWWRPVLTFKRALSKRTMPKISVYYFLLCQNHKMRHYFYACCSFQDMTVQVTKTPTVLERYWWTKCISRFNIINEFCCCLESLIMYLWPRLIWVCICTCVSYTYMQAKVQLNS